MYENEMRDERGVEVIEAAPMPIEWLQEHLTPDNIKLVIGGVLLIGLCATAAGRSVSMKLGPLMLNVV